MIDLRDWFDFAVVPSINFFLGNHYTLNVLVSIGFWAIVAGLVSNKGEFGKGVLFATVFGIVTPISLVALIVFLPVIFILLGIAVVVAGIMALVGKLKRKFL